MSFARCFVVERSKIFSFIVDLTLTCSMIPRSQFGVRSFFPVLSFKSRAAITNKWNEWLANHWSHSPYHSISFKKFQIFVPPFNRLSKTDQKWFSHVSLPHKYIPHTLYCCFAYFIIPLFHGKKHNNLELTMYEHITWLLLVCD